MKLRQVVLFLLRLALGGLLALAGILKLRDPTAFATEIANYQMFPGIAPYLAATLPMIEVVIGAGLIALPLAWRRPGTWLALGLFGMFTLAVASAYFRRINIDCGCFGTGGGPIDALTLLRNLALSGGAGCLLRFERPTAVH
ncbi:MAG TPA: MauE/DoxX family redox-associated membrane protein [Polyangia bacterium]